MPGSTDFPVALDSFPTIDANTQEDAVGVEHDEVHANVHAAIEALQAKVGIDGSADSTSLDARVAAVETGGLDTSDLGVTVAQLVAGKVPSAQLPSYVDDVLEFANAAAFPGTGETGKIYIADDTQAQYRWTGSAYVMLTASPGTTDAVPEGTGNLYFTAQRVRDAVLTGLSTATNAVISATDSVLVAFGKLQKQVSDNLTSLTAAIAAGDAANQPLDSDLTAIAALTPTNDDVLQRKAGSWINRTLAQLATDLGLASYATQAYVDNAVTGLWDIKGSNDCSGNPNYPNALKGDAYVVSVAGKIGGASGTSVDVGDVYVALADNAGGTEASVGSSWIHIEHNLVGVVLTGDSRLDLAATTHAATSKTTPVDADELPLVDSAASNGLKKLTWANLKLALGLRPKGVVALTDATTIAVDASLGDNFRVVLGGNRTLGNPTSLVDGQTFNIRIHQDGTGSRTLAYGSKYKFAGATTPALSTAASARDFLSCQYDATDDTINAVLNKAFG